MKHASVRRAVTGGVLEESRQADKRKVSDLCFCCSFTKEEELPTMWNCNATSSVKYRCVAAYVQAEGTPTNTPSPAAPGVVRERHPLTLTGVQTSSRTALRCTGLRGVLHRGGLSSAEYMQFYNARAGHDKAGCRGCSGACEGIYAAQARTEEGERWCCPVSPTLCAATRPGARS